MLQSQYSSTGRADYFGSVANMAARIMVTAQPGQVFVQGTSALVSLGSPLPLDVLQLLPTDATTTRANGGATRPVQEGQNSRMSESSSPAAGTVDADAPSVFSQSMLRFRTTSREDQGV